MGGRAQTSGLGKGERTWSCQERIVKDVPLRRSRDSFFLFSLLCSFVTERSRNCPINQTGSPKQREHVMKGLRDGCDHLCFALYVHVCVCMCSV